ncbi:MAG: site-2 protease family protein, partial [Burkholderiaceae bacterium]|nr:site-2 protease family protein [Burkholderiaceae bacterium]
FAWAKFFGVKVLTFSLGFGRKLLGFRKGETEYVIAALPLGGYVKMLGENPNDIVTKAEEPRAFHNQPLWKRFIIVVAGPAMNLVFPVVLYFVVFLSYSELPPSEVGAVFPDLPADGKLVAGDVILAVDDDEVTTFDEVSRIVEDNPGTPLRFRVQRGDEILEHTITPILTEQARPLDLVDEVGRIGFMPHHPTAVIGVTSPSSPAGAARLRTFDRIVSASGQPIDRYLDLERTLGRNGGAMVPVTYLRPVRVDNALGGLAAVEVYDPHVATLTPEPGEGSGLDRAGVEPADLYVSHVTAGSPEHRVGILPGDRLISLDGRPIRLWATFLEDLRLLRGAEHTVVLRRGDETPEKRFRLSHERGVNEHGQRYDLYVVGIRNWVPLVRGAAVANPHPIRYAMSEALSSTLEMMELTAFSVVRLVQGRLT